MLYRTATCTATQGPAAATLVSKAQPDLNTAELRAASWGRLMFVDHKNGEHPTALSAQADVSMALPWRRLRRWPWLQLRKGAAIGWL